MKTTLAALFVASTFLIVTPLVSAQVVGANYPLEFVPSPSVVVQESYVVQRPVVTYSQVIEQPYVVRRPVVTYSQVIEQPYVVQRPVVTYSQVVEPPAVTVYRPGMVVAPRYFVPRTAYRVYAPPVVVYRPAYGPMVTTYRPVAPAVVYPRSVVVRPKVYVRGQPVRNTLRAITP